MNYKPAQPISQRFTINKAVASVRPNDGGKIYGSSDPVLTGTLSGFLPADNVTGIFTRVAGETVGSYTVSGAAGPASVLSNYDITYNTASLMIAPLAVSVTPNPAAKTFGDTDPNPLTTGTLNGFLARDNVTASYSRTAGEAPGQYTINATLAPAAVLSNYTITYNTAGFTIRKYMFSVCDGNGHCTGGSKPNDNGIGSRITITSPAEYGGNATSDGDRIASDGQRQECVDQSRRRRYQSAVAAGDDRMAGRRWRSHTSGLVRDGDATRVGPDANGNQAWQTSITAPLNVPSPGLHRVCLW